MITTTDGFPQKTLSERLSLIPSPRVPLTSKERRETLISNLRPYFIIPKAEPSRFVVWMKEELGLREFTAEELTVPFYRHEIDMRRMTPSDDLWLLEKNERNREFFETEFFNGDFLNPEYEDDVIVVGYNPEIDTFYSSSTFLQNTLMYFRGIDPEDLLRQSKELFPVRTANAYAEHLDAALRTFTSYVIEQTVLRILRSEKLTVKYPKKKAVTVSSAEFLPFFRDLVSHNFLIQDYCPQPDGSPAYSLVFAGADGERAQLVFENGRLCFDLRGFFEFQEADVAALNGWLENVLKTRPRKTPARRKSPGPGKSAAGSREKKTGQKDG